MSDLASHIRDLCASMDRLAKAIESTRAVSSKCDALASWGVMNYRPRGEAQPVDRWPGTVPPFRHP